VTPGTLVRVRAERVDPKSGDNHIIAEHGVLWLYVHPLHTSANGDRDRYADRYLHKFRALATNYEHLWFDHEVETTQQGDQP
jgi:hypothetical protein